MNAIKAVKIDKCFSLYKLQRGIVGLLWNRRKLWGTVRRVCNAALLRPNERLMKKNRKTNERTLDVRIGREAYGSRGREGERVVVTIITGSQQGAMQVRDGWPADLASNATSPRALWPSTLFLALVLFHAVIAFNTSLHRCSTPR